MPKSEAIQNLFTLLSVVSSEDTLHFFNEAYNNCTIRYGDLKKQLAEDMILFLNPIREKIEAISADDVYLTNVMKMGKEKHTRLHQNYTGSSTNDWNTLLKILYK